MSIPPRRPHGCDLRADLSEAEGHDIVRGSSILRIAVEGRSCHGDAPRLVDAHALQIVQAVIRSIEAVLPSHGSVRAKGVRLKVDRVGAPRIAGDDYLA